MNYFRIRNSHVGPRLACRVLSMVLILFALLRVSPSCFAQTGPTDENAAIKEAAQSMIAGDLQRAETELQSILQTDPGEYRALNLLGMIRAQQQRNAEAEKIFKDVIRGNPTFAGAHVNLGLLYLQTSRLDDATAQFQEALRLEPGRDDALDALLNTWRVQARDAVQSGNMEKALSLLIQARKAGPRDPDVLYDFGMVALRMSLFPDAATAFQDVLDIRPEDASALYGEGRAEIGLAKYEDAAATFARYVQMHPRDASGHYALGVSLASLEKASEARAQFQKSLELQPNQTESYLQLGRICLDEGNLDCAAEQFDRVLTRDPRHAPALSGMGRVEFQRKDYAKAVDLLQRSVAIDPSRREAHYYLGMVYARLGRSADSNKELQVAAAIDEKEVSEHRVIPKLLDSEDDPDGIKKP